MQNFFYTYILYSQKYGGLYIGYSENLPNRIQAHKKGKVNSTKNRRPLILIHYEAFRNINDAKSRERYLKSGYGRDQIKIFLKRDLSKLEIIK